MAAIGAESARSMRLEWSLGAVTAVFYVNFPLFSLVYSPT